MQFKRIKFEEITDEIKTLQLDQSNYDYTQLKDFGQKLHYALIMALSNYDQYLDNFICKRQTKDSDQMIIINIMKYLSPLFINISNADNEVKDNTWDYFRLFLYPEYAKQPDENTQTYLIQIFFVSLIYSLLQKFELKNYILFSSFLSRSSKKSDDYTFDDYLSTIRTSQQDKQYLEDINKNIFYFSKNVINSLQRHLGCGKSNTQMNQLDTHFNNS